jgi:hypothetical protein
MASFLTWLFSDKVTKKPAKFDRKRREHVLVPKNDLSNLSVKNMKNRESKELYLSNEVRFMSKSNGAFLIKALYRMTNAEREIGDIQITPTEISKHIYKMMKKFADKFRLNTWNDITSRNQSETMTAINTKFLKLNQFYFTQKDRGAGNLKPDVNVFRKSAPTGTYDPEFNISKRKQKRYVDMLASDYGSLDLWKPQNVYTSTEDRRTNDPIFKRGVPSWRLHAARRNVDTGVDNQATADRASLVVPIRGYNFTHLYSDKNRSLNNKKTGRPIGRLAQLKL